MSDEGRICEDGYACLAPDCACPTKPDTKALVAERGDDYGHPLDNHTCTAKLVSAYLQRKHGVRICLDADDVCWFNVLQKVSREANRPKRDNRDDIRGYVENVEMIHAERQRRFGK